MRYRRYRRRRYRRLPYPIAYLSRTTNRYNPSSARGVKRKYPFAEPYDPTRPYKKLVPTDRYYAAKKGNLRSNQFRDWSGITTARAIDQWGWISDTKPYHSAMNYLKRVYSPKSERDYNKRLRFRESEL